VALQLDIQAVAEQAVQRVEPRGGEVALAGRDRAVERAGPVSLSLSWRLRGLDRPSDIAERLPKSLIHHNVPGRPVYDLLAALGHAWDASATPFGPRQRWLAAVTRMREAGWSVVDGPARWRLGELTVPWPTARS
jgi:hypothetical protein